MFQPIAACLRAVSTRRVLLATLLVALAFGRAAPAVEAPPKPQDEEYYELYKLLVDTMDQVERNYVKEVDRRKLFEAAIRGALSELDSYSSYISPDELAQFRSNVEAEFGGIGVQVGIDEGQLKVISPLVGTPAYRAGILAGDHIVEIDGEATKGLSLDAAVKRLKGKEGTSVTLTVANPGRRSRETFTLMREIVHVETVLGSRRKPDDSWDFMIDPERHVGYIRVTAFSRDTVREVRKVLDDLKSQNLRGLVLDLRFNPGGLLSAAIEMADLFVAEGRIVSTKGRNSPERVWDARKDGSFEGFPMVVLVNRFSASASEIVAACLQDHQRAVILGERTWGKGSVQNVIELEDGTSALKLTTAGYLRPSGKNIHRFDGADPNGEWGVLPNDGYEVKLGDAEVVGLLRYRRELEIVRPHDAPAEAASEAASETTDEAAPAGDDENSDEPQGEKEEPKEGDGDDADEKGNADENGDEGAEGQEKPAAADDAPSADQAPPAAGEPAFVDRQLKMAVEYLSNELARAE